MEPDRVLTLRELNRATLARQMLLTRESLPVSDTVERLVGLQAQVPNPPYIGLWTRLWDFRRDDLTRLLEQREIVRATLMRSTLHLMRAEDYLLLRPALQPALTRSLRSIGGKRLEGLDLDRLVAAARTSVEEAPRTFTELRGLLSGLEPDRDPSALAYLVRTHLPLVQVPPGGTWGTGAVRPRRSRSRGSACSSHDELNSNRSEPREQNPDLLHVSEDLCFATSWLSSCHLRDP
jgi:hypothetical protein